jgi:hypothetical protein
VPHYLLLHCCEYELPDCLVGVYLFEDYYGLDEVAQALVSELGDFLQGEEVLEELEDVLMGLLGVVYQQVPQLQDMTRNLFISGFLRFVLKIGAIVERNRLAEGLVEVAISKHIEIIRKKLVNASAVALLLMQGLL